ncbi:MAG TPA: hypothetical protein VLK84_19460 [Longimicrobium sp.]|nr:hypothetical protein [Longimicrobium sp.]
MTAIFLSASVPVPGRGHYHETADPFLIQVAVRELVAAVIRDHHLVWGGHPAITPMIWTICEDLGVEYARSVTLYQSRFFAEWFPEENKRFSNAVLVDAVPEDREASLLKMREQMLSRDDLHAAVFVGGMQGVAAEYELYRRFHPEGRVLAAGAPGGAARDLADQIGDREARTTVDFAHLFRTAFPASGTER